jgi:hypothetical protein
MKRWLLRIENLLFLVPIVMVFPFAYELWASWYGQNQYESFSLPGQSLGDSIFSVFITFIPEIIYSILPIYMMHYFLRVLNIRPRRICVIHILATVLYVLYFYLTSSLAVSVVPGWHTSILPPLWGSFFYGIWSPLWIMQAAFLIYGFILIRRWRKLRG